MSDYLLCDNELALWSPYNLDAFFSGHLAVAELEVGQGDTNEFTNLPYYLPIDSALDDCQLITESDLSYPDGANRTEHGVSLSSKTLSLLKPMVRPWPPNSSLVHHPDNPERVPLPSLAISPAQLPAINAKRSFSGESPIVKRRKRVPAQRSKTEGRTACPDADPAAAVEHYKKHSRVCHNSVEKNYRSRLNNAFKMLLDVLVDCADNEDLLSVGLTDDGLRNQSKWSILRRARQRVLSLQMQNRSIASELETLR